MKTAIEQSPATKTTGIKYRNRNRFSSRKWRFWSQLISLFIISWIGIEFYLYVKYLESGGSWRFLGIIPGRPPGVEGFLPLSALVSIRDWFYTGVLNSIHPAAVVILLTAVGVSFLFKKGFCSWVCPVGYISEMVGNIGDWIINRIRKFTGRDPKSKLNKVGETRFKLPKILDYPLRSLKYLLLLFFAYAIFWSMSPAAIHQFVASPYNKIADIKMLKFFTEIDTVGLWTVIILFALSVVLRGFWCRYLCPYGALLGIFSLISPLKIKRNKIACIDCGKCARACPSFIKVDNVKQVISDECTGCLDCVDVCPVKGALETQMVGSRKRVPIKVWVISLLILFWGSLLVFKTLGSWQTSVTTEEYLQHVEKMDGGDYNHPGR